MQGVEPSSQAVIGLSAKSTDSEPTIIMDLLENRLCPKHLTRRLHCVNSSLVDNATKIRKVAVLLDMASESALPNFHTPITCKAISHYGYEWTLSPWYILVVKNSPLESDARQLDNTLSDSAILQIIFAEISAQTKWHQSISFTRTRTSPVNEFGPDSLPLSYAFVLRLWFVQTHQKLIFSSKDTLSPAYVRSRLVDIKHTIRVSNTQVWKETWSPSLWWSQTLEYFQCRWVKYTAM